MAECIGSFIGPIWECGKWLYVHIKLRVDYVRKIGENFEDLEKQEKHLDDRKNDINNVIKKDEVFKMPSAECKTWLDEVKKIEETTSIIKVQFKENKRCLSGWCPNIRSRYKLGKRIVTIKNDIITYAQNSEFKGGVVVDAPPRRDEPGSSLSMMAKGPVDHAIEKILECLRDVEIEMIGVCGMGGIGKTTILNELRMRKEIAEMFQIVILVTVSRDWSLEKMQKRIAERLLLNVSNDQSIHRTAIEIYEKLNTMKYLLLLDDVWEEVDLNALKVPMPTRENGCKIILTSRDKKICNFMRSDEIVEVELLSLEDACNLFGKIVGKVVDSQHIKPLARDIVKECDGLPLAINVMGKSLRNVSDVHVWKNALTVLRTPSKSDIYGLKEKVFKILQYSYDKLDENVKTCLLYCALYPEDFDIDEFEWVNHLWVEGLIGRRETLYDAFNEGYAFLAVLKDAFLLERNKITEISEGNPYSGMKCTFKMHDLIRDMTLNITSNIGGENFCRSLVRAGKRIQEAPKEEEWRHVKWVSLMCNDLHLLPERPECTMLSTLLLQENKNLCTIPELFFEKMYDLRVLNLSRTGIKKLPSSFSKLENIRGLFLDGISKLRCEVGHLKRLEMLHLFYDNRDPWNIDGIKHLPKGIEQLTCLRSLRLLLSISTSFPSGVLSRLSLLEDLRIRIEFRSETVFSELNSSAFSTNGEVVVMELVKLEKLTHLEFPFPTEESFQHFIHESNPWKDKSLKSFWFSVGIFNGTSNERASLEYQVVEDTEICFYGTKNIPIVVMEEVLIRSCALILHEHKSATMLSDISSIEKMENLTYFLVKECISVEAIGDGNGSRIHEVLPNLKALILNELPNFKSIWKGALPLQIMANLKYLELFDCEKLTKVLSRDMIQLLSNLETLIISCCHAVEEIVDGESGREIEIVIKNNGDDDDRNIVQFFPKLKELKLLNLQNLVGICKLVPNPMDWPSLNSICIIQCPNLKRFPLSIANAPSLMEITGEDREWWESLEWDDASVTKQQVSQLHRREEWLNSIEPLEDMPYNFFNPRLYSFSVL